MLTPITFPMEFITAFPTAPEPPPPKIETLGDPQFLVNGSHPPTKLFMPPGTPPDKPPVNVDTVPATPCT